jgi:hypothetical protein
MFDSITTDGLKNLRAGIHTHADPAVANSVSRMAVGYLIDEEIAKREMTLLQVASDPTPEPLPATKKK